MSFSKTTALALLKGPNGEKRPADAIGFAVMIDTIATGEIDDTKVA